MKPAFVSVLRAGLIPRLFCLVLVLIIHTLCQAQTITLNGSGTDPEGAVLTYRWRQLTGPVLVTYSPSANVAKPSITAVWQTGVYSFELTVTDPGGLTGRDTMTVTVTRPNGAPSANAGGDQTITLPATVAIIGSLDAPGLTVEWVKMSGPAQGTIKFPNQSVTDVTGLVKGQYVFRKTVRNASGLTASDDVVVTVKNKCTWLMRIFRMC